MCYLTNNHIRDYGDTGFIDNINYCKNAGLDIVGAGENFAEASKPIILKIGHKILPFLTIEKEELPKRFNYTSIKNTFKAKILTYYLNYNMIIPMKSFWLQFTNPKLSKEITILF